jgi:hypothetical protein
MAADVVFAQQSAWYTNSHTWSKITEYALTCADEPAPGDSQEYVDMLGIDFTLMPDDKAAEVASWLSRIIERMLADGIIGPGGTDRDHARALIEKLRSEMRARVSRG